MKLRAASVPGDKDCWNIRAGRATTVDIPPGTKKIRGEPWKVDLDVEAIHLGFYALASTWWGVQLFSPEGFTLETEHPGQRHPHPHEPVRGQGDRGRFPDPLPLTWANYADDVSPGDITQPCVFDVPAGMKKAELRMSIGGKVDAGGLGMAFMSSDLTPKSMKVTFVKQ